MQLQCNVNVLHCCEHSGDCSSARSVGPCGHWWPLTRPHTVSILSWYRGAPHTGLTQGRASYWANAGASLTVSILPWCRGEPHTGLIRGRASCEGLGHGAGKTQNQAEPDPNATLLIFACRSFEHKLMDWLTNWHMDTLWKLIKTWQGNGRIWQILEATMEIAMCDPPLSGRYVTSAVCKVAVDRVAFLVGLTARRWHSNQQSAAQNMMDTASHTIATHLSTRRRRSGFCHKYVTISDCLDSGLETEVPWSSQKMSKVPHQQCTINLRPSPCDRLVSRNKSGIIVIPGLTFPQCQRSVYTLQLSLSGPE